MTDPLLSDGRTLVMFWNVLRSSQMGNHSAERAAFIVRSQDGSTSCVFWPATHKYKSAQYRGALPARTIAIVHSHPDCCVAPSAQDIAEARQFGVPFYVVTTRNIYRSDGGTGSVRAVTSNDDWRPDGRDLAGCGCKEAPASRSRLLNARAVPR